MTTIVNIKACIKALGSFKIDERKLLVEYADLISQSDLQSKIILYTDSLENILDVLEAEDGEYADADFTEFRIQLQDMINAGADQYIFD